MGHRRHSWGLDDGRLGGEGTGQVGRGCGRLGVQVRATGKGPGQACGKLSGSGAAEGGEHIPS